MARYSSTIVTDEGMPGRPLEGTLVTVVASSGQLANLTDDNGYTMQNPVKLGSLGVLEFNIPDPGDTLTMQYRYGGRLVREDNVIVGTPPQFKGPPGADLGAIGTFATAATSLIPTGVLAVRTIAYDSNGLGAATYVKFDLGSTAANDAFVASYPRAAFKNGNGLYYRLSLTTITFEMFGAIGDGVTNDQPAMQACLDYAAAMQIRHVQYGSRYAVWCPLRSTTAYTDLNTDGIPLVVRSSMLMEPLGAYATFLVMSYEGLSRVTHWQTPPTPGTNIWRGGGIYLFGNTTAPATGTALNIEYFEMRNTKVDGGCPSTGNHGDPNAPGMNGDGWDQTDKGFRVQDTLVGDLTLCNVEITGFRGEVLYGGGLNSARSLTTLDCYIHATNGDAYNFDCNARLVDRGSQFGDAYQPVEINGGPGSSFRGTRFFSTINGGTLWGGLVGGLHNPDGSLQPGTTYAEGQRVSGNVVPWFDIDITIDDCGHGTNALLIANFVRGRIKATDSSIGIVSDQTRFNTCIDLDISSWADRYNVGSAVYLAGPPTTTTLYAGGPRYLEGPSNVNIVLRCGQTEQALANGMIIQQPVAWDGFMKPNVVVILQDCIAARAPSTTTTPVSSMPCIRYDRVALGNPVSANKPLNNVGSTNAVRFTGPIVSYYANGGTGDYPAAIDSSGFEDGQIVDVMWSGAGSTMTISSGGGARIPGATLSLTNNQTARFKYNKPLGKFDYVSLTAALQ